MVRSGQPLALHVATIDLTTPLTYVWKKDGVVVGTNSTAYTVDHLALGHTGWYTCSVTENGGATFTTPRAYVEVHPAGSLPTTGIVGLCVVAAACVLAGAFIIMRRE